MPSLSFQEWSMNRNRDFDEIENAHAAVGGTARGRRFATRQINRAYAVLLASQFQGFCRDLRSECVDHLLMAIAPPPSLRPILRAELTRGRQVDRGNAQASSLGSDVGRLGVDFWQEVARHDPGIPDLKRDLESLNQWRNAVAHQDLDPSKLGGTANLRLASVRRWRRSCRKMARSSDEVLRVYLQGLTGSSPW